MAGGTSSNFTSDGQLYLSIKSPGYGDMACNLGVAVTCLAVLALTLQSAAIQVSISLPAQTYTALPDIFDINCVAFSLNASGVFTAEVAMARKLQLCSAYWPWLCERPLWVASGLPQRSFIQRYIELMFPRCRSGICVRHRGFRSCCHVM